MQAAADWSEPGAEYVPASLWTFYEHYEGTTLNAFDGYGGYEDYRPAEMSSTKFYEELQDALAPPGP